MQIRIRPLEERDLAEADRILRLAFGTFLGLPDPLKMFGDSDASSGLPAPGLARLAPSERDVSFHYKRLGQRAAIHQLGPAFG